ncbi:MAG: helix-turn-helix transcriptional regulator [Candidatus Kerfeldbacteria bacterium]|nr:helix-turn-helix transcriptional regulator [Candidatus Kerfeldbacteria bacterium]
MAILMNHVRKFRQRAGLSQDEIARAVGVSRQTIIAIERGNYTPSVALALRLSKLFGRSVEDLFYWT